MQHECSADTLLTTQTICWCTTSQGADNLYASDHLPAHHLRTCIQGMGPGTSTLTPEATRPAVPASCSCVHRSAGTSQLSTCCCAPAVPVHVTCMSHTDMARKAQIQAGAVTQKAGYTLVDMYQLLDAHAALPRPGPPAHCCTWRLRTTTAAACIQHAPKALPHTPKLTSKL